MYEPGVAKEKLKVWIDIPEELQIVLRGEMKKNRDELYKENAEIALDVFQDMIIKHVLGMQIYDKIFNKIIRGNPEVENRSDVPPDIEPLAGLVTKSNLLGQDPWGDKELPEKKTEAAARWRRN